MVTNQKKTTNNNKLIWTLWLCTGLLSSGLLSGCLGTTSKKPEQTTKLPTTQPEKVLKPSNPLDDNAFIPRQPVFISISRHITQLPHKKGAASAHKIANINMAKVDVTALDTFLAKMHYRARHYPTNFDDDLSKQQAAQGVYQWLDWIAPYANQPNASFAVLLRAGKLCMIARNLELGESYLTQAFEHFGNAKKLLPTHPELTFLYGAMLAESGAFSSGMKHLKKAAAMNYAESHLSMAQVYLLTEKRQQAIAQLHQYQQLSPQDPRIHRQLEKVNVGEFYIWSK